MQDKGKELYIIGAGSVGGHVAINFDEYNTPYQLMGFLDDDPDKIGREFCGYPVLGPVAKALEYPDAAIVLGIAFPKIKQKIFNLLSQHTGLYFPTLISPHAWVSKGVIFGKGCIIYPGCSINYGTVVGDFIVMNMNCAIGHDCQIDDFSSLAPSVSLGGNTQIGKSVDMGINSSTKQFIRISDDTVVGGQSIVLRNVAAGQTVVGVPAKSIN